MIMIILQINLHYYYLNMENLNSNQNKKKNQDIIKQLKEQVHKSFLQISEMQKLYTMELQHTKKVFQQKEQELRLKQQQLNKKYVQNKSKQGNFMFDIGTIDDSNLLDDISFKAEPDMKDSNLQTLTKMLSCETENIDAQEQLHNLKKLQNSILSEIKFPSVNLLKIFQRANQYCVQNIRLREQLLNSNETNQIYKNKIQQNATIIAKFKSVESNLKNQKQIIVKQFELYKTNMQSVTKNMQSEIDSKNKIIYQMKENIHKLIDVLKCHQIKTDEYSQYIPLNKISPQLHKQQSKQKSGQFKNQLINHEKMNAQKSIKEHHNFNIWPSGIRNLNIISTQIQNQPKRTSVQWRKFEKKNSIRRQ